MTGVSVFIDESGITSSLEPLFSVGALWSSPKSPSNKQTLAFTHKALMDKAYELTRYRRKELSHSEGLAKHDDTMFQEFQNHVVRDGSIYQKEKPWSGYPVKFTVSVAYPILEARMGYSRDFGNEIRARCLMEVLHPLLVYAGNAQIDAEVILDEVVWAKAVSLCGDNFEGPRCPKNLNFHFTYGKSVKIPGLQIVDLVAGVNRHHLLNAESHEAYQLIHKHKIQHLGSKALSMEETF